MMTRRSLFRAAAAAGGVSLLPRGAFASGSAHAAGFWYPEETDPHERTFMQWPVSREVHPDADFLFDLQATIADIASTIAEFELVVMLAAAEHHKSIKKRAILVP